MVLDILSVWVADVKINDYWQQSFSKFTATLTSS